MTIPTITKVVDGYDVNNIPNRGLPADFETNMGLSLTYQAELPVDLNELTTQMNTSISAMNTDIAQANADATTASEQATIATNAANTATAAAADFTATSTTSTLIETGSKTFAIETGKAFVVGQVVRIVSAANTANYMAGQITAASDGSITVDVVATGGSGTFADWSISLDIVSGANAVFYGAITETPYELTGTELNATNGTVQYKTLTTNTTFTDALTDGQSVVLRLNDGVTYVVTWPTVTWITSGGNVAPTLNGADDVVVFWKESSVLYASYLGNAGV